MSLVSFLILLCLKPHCDSLSCESSNLILRLLMLKYIIISDVSEDFTVLIMALNQIGSPLLITQAVLQFAAAVLGLARSPVRRRAEAAPRPAAQRLRSPRARCRRCRRPGRGSCSVYAFVYPSLLYVAFRPAHETIASTGSAAGQKQSKKRLCLKTPQPSFRCSWHLLLVRSGRVRGQRGSCSKLSDGLKGLVD